jgi:hypothetical protein
MRKKMKEIKKELDPIIAELTELASLVRKDYDDNPTEISGSVVQVHEDSPYMNENLPDKGWHRVLTRLSPTRIKKSEKK